MNNERHYDVIIIGTGAGGGTLARKLAPTGKRILLLERGDYVPREKDNWSTRAVNVQGKYQTKEVWHDRDGNPLHPHPITAWAAIRNSMARRCSGFAARISAPSNTTAEFLRRGRCSTPSWNLITPRRSMRTTFTASAAKIPPTRQQADRIRTPP